MLSSASSLNRIRSSELARQAGKFVVAGGISTVVNYGVFFVLYRPFHFSYLVASAAGYVAGVGLGYLLNRSWTFRSMRKGRTVAYEGAGYFAVYAVSLLLGLACIRVLVHTMQIDPLLANLGSLALTTVTNFLGTKFLVFRTIHA